MNEGMPHVDGENKTSIDTEFHDLIESDQSRDSDGHYVGPLKEEFCSLTGYVLEPPKGVEAGGV